MKKRYHNLPRPMSVEDYEVTATQVVESLTDVIGVSAVYRFGANWQPGVSDLDILVVTESNTEPHLPSPWSLSPKASFLFNHRYLVADRPTVRGLYLLFPEETTRLKLLCGKEVDFERPSKALPRAEYKELLAGIFFDLLVNKLLPLAGSIPLVGSVNVRQRIGQLYSLQYSETLLNLICRYEMDPVFKRKVTDLRNRWFEQSENKSLALLEEVSEESIGVILGMVESFKTHTEKDSVAVSRFDNGRYEILFVKEWTNARFLSAYRRGFVRLGLWGRRLEHDTLVVPQELSVYLAWYTAEKGSFGTRVREAVRGIPESAQVPAGFARHAVALNRAFEDFVQSAGAHKIPYAYGFRLSSSRWRTFISRIVIKVHKMRP